MSDPQIRIGELWRQIHKEIHERFRNTFKAFDVPPMSLFLSREIEKEPGVTISELARRTGTVKSHVSTLVEQMVRHGWVEKRSDPGDQRLQRIYKSECATGPMAQMETQMLALWSQVTNSMSEQELEQVALGLRTLLAALERAREPAEAETVRDSQ